MDWGGDGEGEEEEEKVEKRGGGGDGLKAFISQFGANWQHPPSMEAADGGQTHTITHAL